MKYCLAIVISIAASKAFAQNYVMDPGTPFLPEKYAGEKNYIGDNDKAFFTLKKDTKGKSYNYYIDKFDKKSQKKEWTVDIKFAELTWEVPLVALGELVRTVLTNDKLYVFVKYYDKPAQEVKCLMKTITLDGKQDDFKEIARMQSDSWGINGRNFYYILCPDKSKLLLMQEFEWPKKPSETHIILYDLKNFEKIWEKDLPNGYNNSTLSTYSYNLDNAGNFNFLFRYRLSSENEDLGICMGILNSKSDQAKIIELNPEQGKEIYNSRVMQTKDGKFLYTGIYKDIYNKKEKKNRKAGIFAFLISPSGSIESSQFSPFPADVDQKLTYDLGLVEAAAGQKYYSITKLEEMNGSFYLFENHSYTINSNGAYTSYEREFIVTRIDGKGKVQWTKIFPKATFSKMNTYNIVARNNKFYLFYMENPVNLEKYTLETYEPKKYKEIGKFNGSTFMGLEISEDGSASRKVIMENNGWCYDPEPYNILVDKDNGLLLRMVYDKSQKGHDKRTENDGKERYDILRIQ